MRRMYWFFSVLIGLVALSWIGYAEEGGAGAGGAGLNMGNALALLAAGATIAIAAFGGAFGQGRTASTTMEGLARNPGAQPQMFMPWIVSMALIESLVIYALVIAFMILGKVK